MNRLLAGTAVIALCAFWSGASLAGSDSDSAAATAKMPTDLTGEVARAQDLRRQGHFKEAASALSQLMLVAPDDARVVGEYGKVLAQEGRAEDAVAFLKRAVELQTNDWTLYSALGVAYDETNNSTDARDAYEHALALKPGEPTVLNNYGMSRMLAGDLAGAQAKFAQAAAAGATNPKIANNAAMVAELEARKTAAHPVVTAQMTPPQQAPRAAAPKPQAIATAAPKSVVATVALADAGKTAPASNPNVVMEKVPFDPLAGPVKPKVAAASHAPRKLSHTTVLADKTGAPVLRTAADTK
ncbi:MAG TPA: tetratricopeptide repeat protein [Rhizomicrobium sp.]|nr:tetratricopeptide repeat protein [Rhizomicrobium sp.]